MSEQRKKNEKNFLVQGSILAIAGVITKLIGAFYRIPLLNIIGTEGNGYYSVAFSIYSVALMLTSYSLPLAVSKLVSARVAVGEYKNAGKIKREINEPDPFAPIIPDQTKDKVWQKMSTRGKYRLTKDLAERMGLDNVIVYEHESDLPVSVRSLKKQGGKIGGYYMHNGNIGIVLDNIPSYTRLQRVLLHEAIGHQGLDALFGDSYFKDEFLMKVYRSMPSEWKLRGNSWNARKTDAEEYLADLASNGVSSSAWNQIYGELRNMLRIFIPGLNFSEREIRNILIRSKNALKKDDSISEMNKKIRQRHLNESDDLGTPLTESDPETYRFLWENDPEWKNYKKFYDHVYGESTDIND